MRFSVRLFTDYNASKIDTGTLQNDNLIRTFFNHFVL